MDEYGREQLMERIRSLESENRFLKECIRGTKLCVELKDFSRWVKNNFGGDE